MVRILTYNVHRCVGVDRRLDVGRIAEAIAAQAPDIVALQELDVGRARTGGVDQAHQIAQRLGMAFHFNAALRVEEEQYGDAILTALPERLVKAGPLPGHPRFARLEPRGALWVAIEVGDCELHVINTHLGLSPREQRGQAAALMGPEWLGKVPGGAPLVVAGDMNAAPPALAWKLFAAHLTESRRAAVYTHHAFTFPSPFPVLPIDHLFVGAGVTVERVRAPSDPLTRQASDHLPLVADLRLDAWQTPAP
jgi:endonuclease/exonuclease/phosphatase family metal-dependent hydrolase